MGGLFRGGAHPPENKERTRDLPIRQARAPAFVCIPFSQHIGKPAEPLAKPGEKVLRGQKIADSSGFVSAGVHASISGTVKSVVQLRHPLGFLMDAVRIDSDGRDEWAPGVNVERDVSKLAPEEIKEIVHGAGIVGMGGASFPTHVKLSPPKDKPVDAFILNGSECEMYITADDRLMRERADAVAAGMRLFMKAVGATKGLIGVENNKPAAIEAMTAAAARELPGTRVVPLPVMYPQGAEKQLIYSLLGKEVPSGGLPSDVGVLVHNVASVYAGYEACALSRPLTSRVVTVTGPGMEKPANLEVRIGVMAADLLDECGFNPALTKKLVLGGAMMGFPMRDLEWAVVKGTNGVIALSDPAAHRYGNCIRCGRCVEGCPMGLLPCELSVCGEAGRLAESDEFGARDCIECGVCSYVCPARRPIVQWVRMEKAEINRARQMGLKK